MKTLRIAADEQPQLLVSKEQLRSEVLRVIAPEGDPTPGEEALAAQQHLLIDLKFLALEHLELLCRSRSDVRRFWAWGRGFLRRTQAEYSVKRPTYAADPRTGRFHLPLTFEKVITDACTDLLLVFGMGLDSGGERGRIPAGYEQPPPLRSRGRATDS